MRQAKPPRIQRVERYGPIRIPFYREDLSLIAPPKGFPQECLAVGWLDGGHGYSRGVTPVRFRAALWEAVSQPSDPDLAVEDYEWDACPLCPMPSILGLEVSLGHRTARLGAAELLVRSDSGECFLAPDLLFHFVTEHQYQPPGKFIRAAMASTSPPYPAR